MGSAVCPAQTPYTGPLPVFDVVTIKPVAQSAARVFAHGPLVPKL